MKIHFLLTILLLQAACSSPTAENTENESTDSTGMVEIREFGKMPDGREVSEYTLSNPNGMSVKVINYGGIITSILVPDKNGELADIVLGYENLESYLTENPYFGAIVGRYGNRIAKGRFVLDTVEYTLVTNNIGNHLHGGEVGFDKVFWEIEPVEHPEGSALRLTYTSKDMEEGYPGNLRVTVHYILRNDNSLTFDYEATTDKPTVVNLTQHTYFNLTGSETDILGHELMLNAPEFLPVDSTLIPTGEIRKVSGTPFDFTTPKPVGRDINQENQQLAYGGGYDHCWILQGDSSSRLAATLYDPGSGRFMEVHTTEPGIQFYSGNFLDGSLSGKGKTYGYRNGLCLETQHFPDSPNQPGFPSVRLNPGETYKTQTKLVFTTK